MSDISELLTKYYKQDVSSKAETPWKNDVPPPSFRNFCTSNYYLGKHLRLTTPQMDIAEMICGKAGGDVFRPWHLVDCASILVFEGGKGVGKNTVIGYVGAYMAVVLDHMRAPRQWLMLGREDALEQDENAAKAMLVVNVSTSATQAEDVAFSFVADLVKSMPYFNHKYLIYDERSEQRGKSRWTNLADGADPKADPRDAITIKSGEISFPRKIQFCSKPSLAEASEGGDIIAFFFDEIAGFIKAHKKNEWKNIVRTLMSSSSSRAGVRTRGVFMSYPREIFGDPIIELREMAQSGKISGWRGVQLTTLEGKAEVFGSPDETWKEYQPRNWDGPPYKIPKALQGDFDFDQSDAEMKFLLRPPAVTTPFLAIHTVKSMYDGGLPVAFHTKETAIEELGAHYTGLRLDQIARPHEGGTAYALAVDTSRTQNRTVAILGHTLVESVERTLHEDTGDITQFNRMRQAIYIDGIAIWTPKPDLGVEVSLTNTVETVIDLANIFHAVKVETDYWHPNMQEQVRRAGIKIDYYHKKERDWDRLYALLRNNLISSPYAWDSWEGRNLEHDLSLLRRDGSKITFEGGPLSASPDVADTLVLLVHILTDPKNFILDEALPYTARAGHMGGGQSPPRMFTQPRLSEHQDYSDGPTVVVGRMPRRR